MARKMQNIGYANALSSRPRPAGGKGVYRRIQRYAANDKLSILTGRRARPSAVRLTSAKIGRAMRKQGSGLREDKWTWTRSAKQRSRRRARALIEKHGIAPSEESDEWEEEYRRQFAALKQRHGGSVQIAPAHGDCREGSRCRS